MKLSNLNGMKWPSMAIGRNGCCQYNGQLTGNIKYFYGLPEKKFRGKEK
jgi:hypothetical protein